MLPLFEDETKRELAKLGLTVPRGQRASEPKSAEAFAESCGGPTVVKALVPTGRRGKAGAVRFCATPAECGRATQELIGRSVGGFVTKAVYVEERVAIGRELYLAFSLAGGRIRMLASAAGGVDIEETSARAPDAVIVDEIDPGEGLRPWQAIDVWRRAGISGLPLRQLGEISAALYRCFRASDALLLEINPLAILDDGRLCLVGAMMSVDEHARFRHREWQEAEEAATRSNPRERAVARASVELPGGEAQYIELGGNIGLLVGGGGAGLYLHDLIVDLGGRPANHCVTPPTGQDPRKLKAVISAILDNPNVRSLLVGFNFAQMARADRRFEALAQVMRERAMDLRKFLVVVRLFGAGEAEARKLAQEFPGLTYMPEGATLADAARLIVRLTPQAVEGGRA